jgi:hypothetical protein
MLIVVYPAMGTTKIIILAAFLGGCSVQAPSWEEHPLPRLPELGKVRLPPGFVGYDELTARFASRHPIHVDTAFFERDAWEDYFAGEHNCRAQITVSPYDPTISTPTAYADLLSTKLCDSNWFVTGLEIYTPRWRRYESADPHLWAGEFDYSEVGWFGVYDIPAVAVVLFEPEHGFTIGLWAQEGQEEIYPAEQAVAAARRIAASLAPP